MFLKAGAISLALLLASRLLGLARESALAATFGTSGMADVAVLMLTLPDWIVGVLASGALAYALLPSWAGQPAATVRSSQRSVAIWLLVAGTLFGVALALFRTDVVGWLTAGLPASMRATAAHSLVWSALALPPALLASLWVTRLQHERDFTGMYCANLVVNCALVATVLLAGTRPTAHAGDLLGAGLIAAMLARIAWLWWRQARFVLPSGPETMRPADVPAPSVWLWALLASGLPLVLPFAARSMASPAGEGALATFNYAWKLVELPLLLAIQLVSTLAFPAIAAAFRQGTPVGVNAAAVTVRSAFGLAWALACAACAGLLVGAPAVAQLLFGWGRMDTHSLARVAEWGGVAAWGLLPQALTAVATTVLATQGRLKSAVAAYVLAAAVLFFAGMMGVNDGLTLMVLLNLIFVGVALAVLGALGRPALAWVPWRAMLAPGGALLVVSAGASLFSAGGLGLAGGLAAGATAAAVVGAAAWLGASELRQSLRR